MPAAGPSASVPTTAPSAKRRGHWLGRWLWRLFLLVDVPLLLAVAFGLLAAFLHPRWFWWAQLLAILLPYLATVLAVATIGPVFARRWGWLVLHLVLLGSLAWRTFPPERFATGAAPGEDDLVVMSFNVPQSGPSGEALGDSMVALVEATQPHVIGIQEAWVEAPERNRPARRAVHLRAVAEREPYFLAVPSILSSRIAWNRGLTGVPLLVRDDGIELIEQTAVPLGEADDSDVSMAIRTHFRWQGRDAVHYNLHLRSFGERKPWQDSGNILAVRTWIPYLKRYRTVFQDRATEVEELVSRIDAETLPVLITGDFNETANNWTYRQLRGDRTDAFRLAGAGPGNTYRSDKPFVRIDFILVDEAWDVTAAEVPVAFFSDHRPVIAHLRWREDAAGARERSEE
ncbi:MAG: hypothetical protein HKN04_08945 [Rhodothermaceae bacterium]|nr:hypothetical protein [Rhodothermaceae bacterium]